MSSQFEIEFLENGGVVSPLGFAAGSARGEIKTQGDDIALIVADKAATAAAVFTRTLVKAAPVEISAQHIQEATARAIVVNAGNANCCTGEQGEQDALRMCEIVAQKVGCKPHEVLVCSTGIIGHPLPMEKVEAGLSRLEYSDQQSQNE